MGKDTDIQWCDSTLNPTTGCEGCELWKVGVGGPCYAGNYHETRMAKSLPALYAPNFDEVRLVPGRMAKAAAWSDLTGKTRPGKPWLDGRPRVIFLGDMGDLFSAAVPFDYLKSEVIDHVVSAKGRRHVWMALTKRPARMAHFADWLKANFGIEWPDNLWPGTSITGRASLRRIDALVKVPSARRFLSVEPLIEEVDLTPWLFCERCERDSTPCGRGAYETPLDNAAGGCWFRECHCSPLSLLIVGGESNQSGHLARPFDVQWARELVAQCKDANVCAFVKQIGSRPYDSTVRLAIDGPGSHAVEWDLKDSHGGDWEEWPTNIRIRKFPRARVAHV